MSNNASASRTRTILYKSLVYGIALFIVGVLQSTFFTKINVLNATPDLLLASVLTVAIFDDHRISAIVGIISGFLYCALGGFSYPVYMIFSFLCGYVFWSISERAFAKNYPSFLALAVFAFGAKGLWNLIEISLSATSFNLIGTMIYVVIPELISSMLFCSISYLIFHRISKLFRGTSRKESRIK